MTASIRKLKIAPTAIVGEAPSYDGAGRGELTGLSREMRLRLKRIFDIVMSLVLLVLFSPVFLVVVIASLLSSREPLFFTQTRIGQNRRGSVGRGRIDRRWNDLGGRQFRIVKFRTMHADTPSYATSPVRGSDPRITPVGRVLRRTCLDELPQLFNVLKGEMSLVGPRPEMPFIVEKYDDIQRQRLRAKPGITGPWQLHGLRDRPIHETIGWDLHYVRHWSLHLDLAILFETFVFALRARNH